MRFIFFGSSSSTHSDKELAEYIHTLFRLSAKAHHNRAEENQIEALTLLIEYYEEEHYPISDVKMCCTS